MSGELADFKSKPIGTSLNLFGKSFCVMSRYLVRAPYLIAMWLSCDQILRGGK